MKTVETKDTSINKPASPDGTHTPKKTPVFEAISTVEKTQFNLSHPKNYLGVPLGVASESPVETIIPQKLVKMAGEAAYGAEALGLITRDKQLTKGGQQFVNELTHDTTPEEILNTLQDASHSRLISTSLPAKPIQEVISRYPPAAAVIRILSKKYQMTLPELTEYALEHHPSLAQYLLSNPDATAQQAISESTEQQLELSVSDYTATASYQFKSILFHAGILTTPGSDTSTLDPCNDIWALSPKLDKAIQKTAVDADNGGEFA